MGRSIIIGFDGASPKIFFDKWKSEFPNIQRLVKEGASGILRSVIPTSTGPAWTSVATGCTPEHHGVFNFVYPDRNLSRIKPTSSLCIARETFYEALERQGKKAVLINLPNSYPPKTKQPTITSLLTAGDEFIFPGSLRKEIPELNDYRISPDNSFLERGDLTGYIDDVRSIEATRFACAKRLFEKEWDIFFLLISGTDWIQHRAYDTMLNKPKSHPVNKRIIAAYKEFDSYVGWFLDNKAEDDTLIILSDHGFDTYKGYFYVNSLFEKAGLLAYKESGDDIRTTKIKADNEKDKRQLKLGGVIKVLRKSRLAYKAVSKAYSLVGKRLGLNAKINLVVNPRKTKAAALRGTEDCVYINEQAFFEPATVPDKQRKRMVAMLKGILENVKTPDGKKLFRQVLTTKNEFKRRAIPNLLVDCKNYYMSPGISPEIFSEETLNKHSPEGIIAALGPKTKKGKITGKSLIDIAPTVMKIAGISPKQPMDGKPIKEIVR